MHLKKSICVRYGIDSAVYRPGLTLTPIKFPLFRILTPPSMMRCCLWIRIDTISETPATDLRLSSVTLLPLRSILIYGSSMFLVGCLSGAQVPHSTKVLKPSSFMPDALNKPSMPAPSLQRPGAIPIGAGKVMPRFVLTYRDMSALLSS